MPSGPVLPTLLSVPRVEMPALEALLCLAAVLGPPRHPSFSDVRYNSIRVSWEAQRPVRLVKVSYISSNGSHSGQVRAGAQKYQGLPGVPRILGRCNIHTGMGNLASLGSHPTYSSSSLFTPQSISVHLLMHNLWDGARHNVNSPSSPRAGIWEIEANTHTYCACAHIHVHVYTYMHSDFMLRLYLDVECSC